MPDCLKSENYSQMLDIEWKLLWKSEIYTVLNHPQHKKNETWQRLQACRWKLCFLKSFSRRNHSKTSKCQTELGPSTFRVFCSQSTESLLVWSIRTLPDVTYSPETKQNIQTNRTELFVEFCDFSRTDIGHMESQIVIFTFQTILQDIEDLTTMLVKCALN